jgi:hypothetical protein
MQGQKDGLGRPFSFDAYFKYGFNAAEPRLCRLTQARLSLLRKTYRNA